MMATEALPVRGNYFAGEDYLSYDVGKGTIRNRSGVRMCALTSDFLLGLQNGIRNECGEAADEILKQTGRRWGQSFAKRLDKELGEWYQCEIQDLPMAQFGACLVEAFLHHGWGRLALDFTQYESGLVIAAVENAPYAGLMQGKSNGPADLMLGGVLAGMFSHWSGNQLDVVQSECPTMGGKLSRFIIADSEKIKAVQHFVREPKAHERILATLGVNVS
jgi:predicted hydrocarbon binding protein